MSEFNNRRKRASINSNNKNSVNSSKSNKNNKNKNSKIKKSFKNIFLSCGIIFLILCFAVAGAGFGILAKVFQDSPNLDLLAIQPNVYTSIVYDMNGEEIDRFHGEENREYVTLDKIPTNLQNALIAVEDRRFYSHFGIDLKGLIRAGITTISSKLSGSSRVEGASTITQQLIKNNVTKVTRNTIKTKIQELYLAINYERQLKKELGSKKAAKDYILELYLNTIALGHGYNGVQSAAIGYFNKDVSELTLAESASIASITNNPSLYSPRSNPEGNKSRQTKVLNDMLEQNMITQEEYNQAIEEDIYSKVSANYKQQQEEGGNIHSYFVDGVFEQVSQDLQEKYNISSAQANNLIYSGGLEIITTQDSSIQKILDETYLNESLFPNVNYSLDVTYIVSVENKTTGEQKHSEYRQFVKNKEAADDFVEKKRKEIEESLSSDEHILADKTNITVQPQSAMVIMDQSNGEVRALIGGRGEKQVNRGFNRAINSLRQPGSVFKILAAFAPGIDLGTLTPATVIDDVPYTIGDYSPSNWYKGYKGLSTIRDAIRDSMNIVAVKAMVETGVDTAYKYLQNFGFTSLENDNHASTALGGITKGVSQLELTAAFASIANGGTYYAPKLYKKVIDRNGQILLESNPEENSKRVLKETTSFLLTDMMQDVITSGTGAKAKFTNSSMPIAGKTGTSQDSKDLTFVGYTPYYTAGIWLGYDVYDNVVKNMSNLSQSTHLNIWRTVMEKVHQNLPKKDFNVPDGIVTATICKDSGLLEGEYCKLDPRGNRVITEYFAEGTQPTETCDVHTAVKIDKETGLLAGEFCPEDQVETIVGIVKKNPYTGTEKIDDSAYVISVPTEVCHLHSEESVVISPNTNITDEKNTQDIINNNQNNENNVNDIFGNIVPSTPTEPSEENTTPPPSQNNSTPNVEDYTTEEPIIDTPN